MPETNINTDQLIHQFLMKLREEGFSIGTESFIQTTQIFNWFKKEKKDEPVAAFAAYLGPVICKSDEEQVRFTQLFTTHFLSPFNDFKKQEAADKLKRRKKWLMILAAAVCLLAAGYFFYYRFTYRPILNYSALLTDTLYTHKLDEQLIDVTTIFKNKKDTADFDIECRFSDGTKKKGASLRYSFARYGKDSVRINIKSAKYNIDTSLLYQNIYVGPEKKEWIIHAKEIALTDEDIDYTTEADTASVKDIYWTIDSVRRPENSKRIRNRFNKPGKYEITVGYDVEKDSFLKKFPEEFTKGSYIQKVNSKELLLTASPADLPLQQSTRLNAIWLLSLLALTVSLILAAIRMLKKKSTLLLYDCAEENFSGSNEPYTIPFVSKEKNISSTYALQRLCNDLKKRTESQLYSINYDKTIRQSIFNRGFITPQFTQKQINREFLFLIDQAYANSQQVKLFTYLLNYFVSRSVQVDFYFYHQQPDKFYKQAGGPKINTDRLRDMHYNATLVFITEGAGLTDYQQPVVRNDIAAAYGFWQNRLLVTPVPANDWSGNEKILSGFFKLLPADIQGLMELVKMIEEDSSLALSKMESRFMSYTSKHDDFSDMESLQAYLKDEELFQWLCAAAVLPKIYWEFFLEAGKVIVSDKSKINYNTLLKLVRIKWVHEGMIPPSVRLELLKKLTVENELAARSTLLKMLDEVQLSEEAFSYEEKQVIKYSGSFILFASGKEEYQSNKSIQEGEQKFLCLYKKNKLLDTPFKIYIEKKQTTKGDWQTPIETKGSDDGIQGYIREKEARMQRDLRNKKIKRFSVISGIIIAALCIILGLIALFFNKDSIANDNKNIFRHLIDTDSVLSNKLMARIIPGECFTQLLNQSGDSSIVFEASYNGSNLYSGNVKVSDTAEIPLDIKALPNGSTWPSQADNINFAVNISGQRIETTARLKAATFNISLTGACTPNNTIITAEYYPGYKDDTTKVIKLLKTAAATVEIKEYGKTGQANRISFSKNIDTDVMHRLCTVLIKAGLPLKQILVETKDNNGVKKIIVDGDAAFDNSPAVSKDSIDCFFKIDCKPKVPPAKSALTIYYNNKELEPEIKKLNSCMSRQLSIIPGNKYSTNISTNQINYYRNSFTDSVSILQNCLRTNFPDKSFAVKKMTRPLAADAAAEIYVSDVSVKPEISIEISDESLRGSVDGFSKNLSASGYAVKGINIGTRNYNSIIEYYDEGVAQQASQVRAIYRQYFPDLPIETRFVSTRAPRKSIIVWIQKFVPVTATPTYKIQNAKFPNEIDRMEKFEIGFEVSSSNVPVNVSQNNLNRIEGSICIYSQQVPCTAFSIDEGNGIKFVSKQIDVSDIHPGRHAVRVRINEMKIDTLLGYFNIKEAVLPQQACDTIESYIGISSIKTYTNTPLYKNHDIQLSLTQNASENGYGIFSIVYNKCKDKKTQTVKTGERVSLEFCNGVRLYLWLQKWENKEKNEKNKEAVFQAIVCDPDLKKAAK